VSSLNMSFNSEIGSIINFNHVTEHANSCEKIHKYWVLPYLTQAFLILMHFS
jgi:hypothetical protein